MSIHEKSNYNIINDLFLTEHKGCGEDYVLKFVAPFFRAWQNPFEDLSVQSIHTPF